MAADKKLTNRNAYLKWPRDIRVVHLGIMCRVAAPWPQWDESRLAEVALVAALQQQTQMTSRFGEFNYILMLILFEGSISSNSAYSILI